MCMCARGKRADTHKACLPVWEVCRKEEREKKKRSDTVRGRQSELENKTGRKEQTQVRAGDEMLDNIY